MSGSPGLSGSARPVTAAQKSAEGIVAGSPAKVRTADRVSRTVRSCRLWHNGGDAETGAGMDVGGGLVVADASTRLAVDLRVRMLVMHQSERFRERGMAVSLSYNPTPSTPLGFVARVAPSWVGQATSGAEALWGQETMAGADWRDDAWIAEGGD